MNREENLHFRPVTTNRLTFLGSGVHYPNNDAIKWFVTEIAPILHRKNFHYSLDVIGSWGEKESKIFEEVKEINKAGYVDALHPFINGSIAIVPIRIGSGMRIKILDSVMSQVPVITTAKGVEGIDLTHEKRMPDSRFCGRICKCHHPPLPGYCIAAATGTAGQPTDGRTVSA